MIKIILIFIGALFPSFVFADFGSQDYSGLFIFLAIALIVVILCIILFIWGTIKFSKTKQKKYLIALVPFGLPFLIIFIYLIYSQIGIYKENKQEEVIGNIAKNISNNIINSIKNDKNIIGYGLEKCNKDKCLIKEGNDKIYFENYSTLEEIKKSNNKIEYNPSVRYDGDIGGFALKSELVRCYFTINKNISNEYSYKNTTCSYISK